MVADLVGREIKGRYRLIDERGSGNFGTVYIARDLLTNYLYAAKIMHIDYTDNNELVERFKREAFILYHLNDEHIVRIIDYGNEGDLYYIVLHHIDGQNLKHYIQHEGKIPPLRALDYVHQAAEGLNAAYKRGVVHRDIKPQNILINNKGVVKIADFGLSRSKDMHTITGSDKFMGTAYYVAPEQVTNSHEADTRADLYSLTALLFEMLAGYPPYAGDRILDVVLKHARAEIPSICLLRPELPPEMDHFMQKALAKEPEARFQSPTEYIAAIEQLQRLLRGEVGASQKQACLLLLENGEVFPLYGSKLLIGREDPKREIHPDITLNDEQRTVGRIHASLSCQQGQWGIEDRNSRNGTRLNGEVLVPYERRPLKDGDQLRFGRVEARFELR